MRGTWSKKCLEMQGKRVIDRSDTVDTVVSGRELGQWVETLLRVAEVRNIHLSAAILVNATCLFFRRNSAS
jgi:exocyst complex protein 7